MSIAVDDPVLSLGARTVAGDAQAASPLVAEPPPTRYPEPEMVRARPAHRVLAWTVMAVVPWLLLLALGLSVAGQGR